MNGCIRNKVEDNLQKSSYQNQNMQSLDFRLLRLEDIADQLNSNMMMMQRLVSSQSETNDRYSKKPVSYPVS